MDPMSYLLEVKRDFFDDNGAYELFLQSIKDFHDQKIDTNNLIKTMMKLFHGNKALILGFNKFLPKQYKVVPTEDVEALGFVKRVETTFKSNHGAFLHFLRILDNYRRKDRSIIEVYKEIAILFRGHDDLLFEFRRFLPDTKVKSSTSPPIDIIHASKKRRIEEKSAKKRECGKLAFFDKVKAASCDSNICQGLLKCVELYSKEIITRPELLELADDLIGEYPELVKEFDEFMKISEKTKLSEDVCSSKSMEDNIEDLDLSKCEQITPSYRLLPMNCRHPAIIHESLNDECVCVNLKEDDFRHRHKNCYEKNLFKCEDNIFEMDMKKHLIEATIESTEELLRKMKSNHELGQISGICLEEHFTRRQLGCIKEFFDDRGSKFLKSLRENTLIVLPIVLKRLLVELNKLSKIREVSREGWHKIFVDNNRKAYGLPKEPTITIEKPTIG